MADVTLDLRGLNCPLPILRARKALRALPPGSALEVFADDPLSPVDFAAYCEASGDSWSKASRPTASSAFLIPAAPANPAATSAFIPSAPGGIVGPFRSASSSQSKSLMSDWSQTFTFYEGRWIEGNPPILGPRDHAFWLASSVFDGARAFEGVAPDLDRHCARVNHSAKTMWLKPTMTAEAIEQLAWDGIKKFAPGAAALYPADVLGRAQRAGLGAARSGIDQVPAVDLRGAPARPLRRRRSPARASPSRWR